MKYLTRLLETPLNSAAKFFPVIALMGARQVGKTTLFTKLLPTGQRITFDPSIDVGGARRDPELFLNNLRLPVILDEIQYAPELLSVIKRRVDEKNQPGQYWLTGSQNLSVLKSVSESLAGRVALFDLFPMTLSERYGTGTPWLSNFLEDPQVFLKSPHPRILQETPESLFSIMWRGGFPGLIGMDEATTTLALDSYFRTYIERDVRLLSEVSDLQEFGRFTQIIANLTAQEINFSELGREIGINYKTAQRWLNILTNSYQWQSLPPYFGKTIKRIAGKHKGYFIDTGMACHLMGISSPRVLMGHPQAGHLFETFVVQDCLKQLSAVLRSAHVYHWRTAAGAEVDLIIEHNGVLYPIEIKLKSHPTYSDIKGIKAFRETYPKLNIAPGIVLCPTDQIWPIDHNTYAVPFDLQH